MSSATIRTLPARAKRRLVRTAALSRAPTRRRDAGALFVAVTLGYLITFLYMIQDLSFRSGADVGMRVASEPLETMLQPAPGTLMARPVALLEFGVGTWEFSPVNTLLGLFIAVLVGLNLALSYLAVRQPRSCGVGASAGLVAGVPALFAGSACCAPVIFLVLGIQATGTLMTAFAWLLPVSIALLLVTLVYVGGKIDPAAV
jgi:hypothetical protein